MDRLVIGTRGSQLALCQARWVAMRLEATGTQCSIREIRTSGDRVQGVPLTDLGAREQVKGLFTKEIEDALLAGEIDLAVHSMKDLPTELDPRLQIGCVPIREDPRDALLGSDLADLRPGDRVGTGSRRRAVQLQALVPGVCVAPIRGNVDTRIRKLREGGFDAIVLAAAGLRRLGRSGEIAQCLDFDHMVPAVGQGALGIEVCRADERVMECLQPLHDAQVAEAVAAERAVLRGIGGGCDVPIGAYAAPCANRLDLVAVAPGQDESLVRARDTAPMDRGQALGAAVAAALERMGANLAPAD